MSKGFFSSSKIQGRQTTGIIARCGSCGLYQHCKSPKMPPTGEGRKKILVVAEAPGKNEDEQNIQLIGKAGKFLRNELKSLGISLDRDCWKTNAVICRRKDNATPDDRHIKACKPNLLNTIKKYEPNVIILLGGVACKSLLSEMWKDDIGGVTRWGGYCIPGTRPNAWIVPTFHPSFLLRCNDDFLTRIFSNHLQLAIDKRKSKPWVEIPDYKKQIEIIIKPSSAINIIKDMIPKKQPFAFDYETNCLKPEGAGTKLVSCSISWRGKRTIAFPWAENLRDIMVKLLRSPARKIASNLNIEDRWSRVKLNTKVRNWYWDTMQAAHIIDNTPGVTGLKFQSFVLLGTEDYDSHVKEFLKSTGKNKFNRIDEIDLEDLLLYNGLDSLLEYKLAMKQIKILESRK